MSPPPPSSPWWRSRRRCCKKSDEGKPKRKFFFLLRRCHVHAFFMTKMTLAQESRVSSLARAPSRAHTVWSVNDGLSGNLLETSGNRPQRFLASSRISTIEKKFLKQELYIKNLETCWKPAGNLRNRPVSGGFQRFSDIPSLTDHTVHTKRGNPLPAFLLLLRQRLVNDHEFTTAMQSNCVVVAAALDATTHRRRRRRRRHQAATSAATTCRRHRCRRHQATTQDGCGARWRA